MLYRKLVGLALVACVSCASAQTFSFGLWGDMPYAKAGDDAKLPAVLKSINSADIAFSIYDGDIKDGSSKCTDNVYTDALAMFNSMKKPVVYIPGDNEWTDCHRLNNGGYDGLERLAHVRKTMFPAATSLGQRTMPLTRQGALGQPFVENIRFHHKAIEFVGLNVPGSNNNLILDAKDCSNKSARTPEQCAASNKEHAERNVANIAWLKESFESAKARKARGLVVVFQGDPGFDLPETEIDERQHPSVSGYTQFLAQLVSETEQFKGQVLLVHGDTHYFKVDKPLYNPAKALSNLTLSQIANLHLPRLQQ
jgi:hypothetical protein